MAARAIGLARVAVGASSWLAPTVVMPFFFGKSYTVPSTDHSQLVIARMFGVRELAIGVFILLNLAPVNVDVVRALLLLGVLCDAVDAAAVAYSYALGGVNARGAVLVGGVACVAAVIGWYTAQAL